MPKRPTIRLDLLEVALSMALTAVVVAAGSAVVVEDVLSRWDGLPTAEAEPLRDRYGPERNSRHAEEWVVRDFFQDERHGFFVDVGANHYRDESNTYYLEIELGWEGMAVEPLRQFAADYARHRPATRFRSFFVSDVSDGRATLYVQSGGSLETSGAREFTERHGEIVDEVDVPTIRLDDLLEREGIESFDFLSMDIELWEPRALAGFDIERFRPRLVCIEAHIEVRQDILDYFAQHDYVVVGQYLRSDMWNLYFMPLVTSEGAS